MTYPIQSGASFRAAQTVEKPSNTLFGRKTPFCTDVYRLLSNSSSSRAPWGMQPNSWTPWLFFLDQRFPVEYELFSLLSHISILSPYFFPFPRGLQHKRKLYIPCCHQNLHVKANGIFVFLLRHPPLLTTTISDGITHTRKNTFLPPLK